MKNKFFSIIVMLSLLFPFIGCGPTSKVSHKDGEKTVMGTTQNMYQIVHEYSLRQVDSMCVADVLPRDLNDWIRRSYNDYETGNNIVRYMYIKELNDNFEMIYLVTPRGDIYAVSKRKVVTE